MISQGDLQGVSELKNDGISSLKYRQLAEEQ